MIAKSRNILINKIVNQGTIVSMHGINIKDGQPDTVYWAHDQYRSFADDHPVLTYPFEIEVTQAEEGQRVTLVECEECQIDA